MLRFNVKKRTILKSFIFILSVFVLAIQPAVQVLADTYDEQIEALQQQINGYQDESGKLKAEADTLQNAIASLNAQQAALSAQIQQKEVEHQQLVQQISNTETRIANQKKALGENLRSMYLEADISPLEMIASSKSIGDYIDKQEYRNTIQSTIQKTLSNIKDLKVQLEGKKTEVEQVIEDQKNMKTTLDSQEAEKNKLLADTQGQEAAYQNLIGQKNSEIEELREQQRLANLRWAGSVAMGANCGGGYSGPWNWCNGYLDQYVDSWGMYSRECVSYAAFKVWQSGRYMPYWGGYGNANQWPGNARAEGIPVDGSPQSGDVAIWLGGTYGHAMYVEAVYGDGTILISEYNLDWTGRYSERVISSAGLQFIHF
ncbi:MAG: CHAP domain-containing protein [Candidatus Woesebacteria bacterium]|jgi:peptidoglycan hydrolase CwlO-like protein